MGGGIALPENDEHFHTQMDYAEAIVEELHEKCVHSSGSLMYWVGFTDQFEEGNWMNPYTKEPMAGEGNWEPGNPNGGVGENCARQASTASSVLPYHSCKTIISEPAGPTLTGSGRTRGVASGTAPSATSQTA